MTKRFFRLPFLALSAVGLVAGAIGSGEPAIALLEPSEWTMDAARHLASRAGFSPRPNEVERLHALGLDKAVERLVSLEGPEPSPLFEPAHTKRLGRQELAGKSQDERQKLVREEQRADQEQFQSLRAWWLRRMVLSERPLEEKMTLFLHGHFATSQRDVRNSYHMLLQNRLLRSHAVGNFKSLVRAISKDPAMLEYLDNNRNNRRTPNENYARELLELFTLGIGNYTETDIKEAARALTGWTFEGNEFVFRDRAHDPGTKTFLGRSGKLTGDDVIDIIFEQKAVETFLPRKLFVFFAHDDPPAALVEALGAAFKANGWEIKPVLSLLFRSREFYSPRARGSQIKSPVDLVVGTLRLLEVDPGPSPMAAALTGRLGQEILLPPSVKGWDGGRAWISSSTILDRANFARPVLGLEGAKPVQARARAKGAPDRKQKADEGLPASRGVPGWDAKAGSRAILGCEEEKLTSEEVVDRLVARFLSVPIEKAERETLVGHHRQGRGNRRLAELIHLVMSSPQYQLQ